ncbi:hypothetical protein IMG5_197840 [Ichthyophthirius multifiliis]|uniref:Tetratricopeptide repeat protein n=1 Tax=Ichthyophthirius multifiliis TaxID=5932 RepID=G0R5C7_ICHMU|nr:hypothetical protein IMG5_197840 [Ichthyophthirius multifiliis]EGR27316.1 hypothetical protein IMG5_197840 [Ichthyophthirius multifiliis]|eukprot:XP_004024200.1 hypothetical protein IMG5_197840 [Ichthyophthirius multifiliis]
MLFQFSNSLFKKNDYETVIQYTTKSIKLDENFKKPYLNRIIAFEKTEREEDALEDLKALEKIDPNDKDLKARIYQMSKFGLSLDSFKLNQNDNGSYNISFNK